MIRQPCFIEPPPNPLPNPRDESIHEIAGAIRNRPAADNTTAARTNFGSPAGNADSDECTNYYCREDANRAGRKRSVSNFKVKNRAVCRNLDWPSAFQRSIRQWRWRSAVRFCYQRRGHTMAIRVSKPGVASPRTATTRVVVIGNTASAKGGFLKHMSTTLTLTGDGSTGMLWFTTPFGARARER